MFKSIYNSYKAYVITVQDRNIDRKSEENC